MRGPGWPSLHLIGEVSKMPNLKRFDADKVLSPLPTVARHHTIWWRRRGSRTRMQAGFGSPEGEAAAGDLPNFATGGATLLIREADG